MICDLQCVHQSARRLHLLRIHKAYLQRGSERPTFLSEAEWKARMATITRSQRGGVARQRERDQGTRCSPVPPAKGREVSACYPVPSPSTSGRDREPQSPREQPSRVESIPQLMDLEFPHPKSRPSETDNFHYETQRDREKKRDQRKHDQLERHRHVRDERDAEIKKKRDRTLSSPIRPIIPPLIPTGLFQSVAPPIVPYVGRARCTRSQPFPVATLTQEHTLPNQPDLRVTIHDLYPHPSQTGKHLPVIPEEDTPEAEASNITIHLPEETLTIETAYRDIAIQACPSLTTQSTSTSLLNPSHHPWGVTPGDITTLACEHPAASVEDLVNLLSEDPKYATVPESASPQDWAIFRAMVEAVVIGRRSMAQQLLWYVYQIQERKSLDEVRLALEKDVRLQVGIEAGRPYERVGHDAYEICLPQLTYPHGSVMPTVTLRAPVTVTAPLQPESEPPLPFSEPVSFPLADASSDPILPSCSFSLTDILAPSTTSPVPPTTSPAPATDELDVPDDWEMLDAE